MDALVGQRVHHYRVDRHIGSGGIGVVYEAEDTRRRDPDLTILHGNPEFERLYAVDREGD